jgi:hypothetical protein
VARDLRALASLASIYQLAGGAVEYIINCHFGSTIKVFDAFIEPL